MKKLIISAGTMIAILVSTANFANAQTHHKKMSDQAKGAIIGGAGGAVAGGIIGHGVGGALIGGAVGAGGGYIIGNEHHRHEVKERQAYLRAHRRSHYRHTYAASH